MSAEGRQIIADQLLNRKSSKARADTLRSADWTDHLIKSGKGVPKPNLHNVITALRRAPEWAGVLGYDEFARKVVAVSPPPWEPPSNRWRRREWADHDDTFATQWLQQAGIDAGVTVVANAVQAVATDLTFHPLHEYLEGLTWDGVGRLDDLLSRYFGASPTPYARAVGSKFAIGAIARALQPGCKRDEVLILEGPQGVRKSTALRTLAGEWFSDELPDIRTKDAQIHLQGVWMVELSELDAMSRAERSAVKAFFSRTADRFRAPYGRRSEDVPRSCVFCGSTNQEAYLQDETGARRFWPIKVGTIDLTMIARDRDQLWAEAVHRYRKGETWWLDSDELREAAATEQEGRYQVDVWEEQIEKELALSNSATTGEVLVKLGIPVERHDPKLQSRVAVILKRLGFVKKQLDRANKRKKVWARVAPLATGGEP